jgi:hypothetical protein
MKKKTVGAKKYAAKALQRSASSWNGAFKMLQLLSRSDVNEDSGIGQVIPSFQALEILSSSGKI